MTIGTKLGEQEQASVREAMKEASVKTTGGQVKYEITCGCGQYLGTREHQIREAEFVDCEICGRKYQVRTTLEAAQVISLLRGGR